MSIETLLTLGLTAAILVAAFVLRLVILGGLRLGLRLAGRDTSWTRPRVAGSGSTSEAADRPERVRPKRPLWTPERAAAIRTKASGVARRTKGMAAVVGTKAKQTATGLSGTVNETAGAGLRTKTQGSSGAGAGSALADAGASVLAIAATVWAAIVRGADALEQWADRTSESLQPAMRDITSAARRSTRDIGKYIVAAIATIQHVVLLLAGWIRGLWTDTKRGEDGSHRTNPEPKKVIDLDIDDDPLGSSSVSSRSRISV